MVIICTECGVTYDDEFRTTTCPHDTFAANDGNNCFRHGVESVGPAAKGDPCPKCGQQLMYGFDRTGNMMAHCPTGCAI